MTAIETHPSEIPYAECGLPNVRLLSYERRFKDGFGLQRPDILHAQIVEGVVRRPGPLTGAEVTYLREQMKRTHISLASKLGMTRERLLEIERGDRVLPSFQDAQLRAMACGHAGLAGTAREFMEVAKRPFDDLYEISVAADDDEYRPWRRLS